MGLTTEQDAIHKIFGIPHTIDYYAFPFPQNIQDLGSVAVRQGRFLAWPNSLRYKTQPFSLSDKSSPGHQRCIIIYLVDLVKSYTDDWPMGMDEAAKYKKESEEERDLAIEAQTEGIGRHNFESPLVYGE
ncbi:uncharacterized protein N7473_009023 [Penicillium subrubescens]|uniref:uncharacterized protein n=1 Tax=Penicillium subrubescens TaxID=1316194 RepID=UPI0025455890|nr:uncharacterized protein N7473_009023 [Penicillium subrubescens]KAJ5886349.1 hypothetical protein N7473_009023 [Penicillium subrubescens]